MRIFSLDVRSLAAMRIGMGFVMLIDLWARAKWLTELFTDDGFVPRSFVAQGMFRWTSLYFLSGGVGWTRFLFVFHALFALMLLIGYRTRLATIACLVLYYSLLNRNPLVAGGGEFLLFWILVWSFFLPLGQVISIDDLILARQGKVRDESLTVCSIGSAALILQLAFMYWGALIARIPHREWWLDWSAVEYVMQARVATPLGHYISNWSALTSLATLGTLGLEMIGLPLVWLSYRSTWLRTTVVGAFIIFHLMLAATIYSGRFQPVCIVTWLALIPGPIWAACRASVAGSKLIQYTSGVGNRLADVLPSRTTGMAWEKTGIAQIFVALLLVYVVLVNVLSDATPILRRPLALSLYLPRMKQSWVMMDDPPKDYRGFIVEADLEDGRTVELLDSFTQSPPKLCNLIWPPEDDIWLALHGVVLRDAISNTMQLTPRFCDLLRRQWDAAHPSESQVRRIRFTCHVQSSSSDNDAASLDLSTASKMYSISKTLYAWDALNPNPTSQPEN
ncbi:MAG TPA: HTTM domain-containing protein [Tepidisphaeraceae bacterium]|jgi:hypothetical protein|nr:HTTM domain-containing protein [Tepidisphaeraceae bacterium]